MGLGNFILTCEKDNKELRKDLEYYKNRISRLEKENQELKEKLLVTQTNEETFRLEMEDITKILGLDEDAIFDDVKAYAKSLKDNMFEKEQLNKQLEEWNHHLKCSKEMLDIQGHNGNYNYDSYMLGIYNGMEYIIALFETREPIFKSGKDIEFISELQQENQELKKQNKKYKEVIDKAIEYTNKHIKDDYYCRKSDYLINNLLDILKEVE